MTTHADHPHTDPGDGRTQCDTCGKYVWPVTHSCKGIRVAPPARPALCWFNGECECDWPNGECICGPCDAELEWIDGRWHCPHGHPLRQHISPWLADHIAVVQGSPGLIRRYFGDRP